MAQSQLTRIELLDRQIKQLVGAIITALSGDYQSIVTKLDAIEREINAPAPGGGVATSVEICVTRYTPIHGGPTMAGTISLTNDHVAHTPIKWSDDVGTVAAPTDAAVSSSDTAIATVAFNVDMTDVDTTPVADGTATWTVSSASLGLSDTVTVNVTNPTASAVAADAAATTFTPKP